MKFIWFIYGLVFFSLGLVIIINPKKSRILKLYKYIWLIASFWILNGINEWLDMFIDLNEPFPPDVLIVIRIGMLVGSFLFLLRFGTKAISEWKKKYRRLQFLHADIYQVAKRLRKVFAQSEKRANLGIAVKDINFVPFMSMSRRGLEQISFILIQNTIDRADAKRR